MKIIFLIAAVISAAYGARLHPRIMGSTTASDGQFPSQVLLRQSNNFNCSGSILNDAWVLTAASCLSGTDASAWTVVTGTNQLNCDGIIYKVQRIILHMGFTNKALDDDIALVQISGKFVFWSKVQPIELETEEIIAGSDAMVSGWGYTSLVPTWNLANFLQFIPVKTISADDCNKDHKNLMCTAAKVNEGVCFGDSGNPLIHNGKLAGITIWFQACGAGIPDIFTKVSAYVPWIHQNMQ